MRKFVLALICAVMIAGYGIGWVVADDAEEMCIPMGTIFIEPPANVDAKRSSVEFPHSIHFEYACQTCHHEWDRSATIQSCTASGCHDLTSSRNEAGKFDAALALKNFKTAYHDMCLGCHKDIKAQNAKLERAYSLKSTMKIGGPTSCNECHPKD